MAATVADILVERLIDWNVDTIFALPGDGINGLYEALRTHQDAVRLVQVRHEEAAALAACGYAKFTRRHEGTCHRLRRKSVGPNTDCPSSDRLSVAMGLERPAAEKLRGLVRQIGRLHRSEGA